MAKPLAVVLCSAARAATLVLSQGGRTSRGYVLLLRICRREDTLMSHQSALLQAVTIYDEHVTAKRCRTCEGLQP